MRKYDNVLAWLYLFCSAWLATGAYVDGWAHNHIPELETFFTPWHAILYSGYLSSVSVLLVWMLLRRKSGHRGLQIIPEGLEFSLTGMLIFFFGGLGDMLWHIVFGIEAGIEALLSPTHLLLATGVFLMASGSAKHWIYLHTIHPRRWTHFPLALSVTFALMVLTYMTQFARYTQII